MLRLLSLCCAALVLMSSSVHAEEFLKLNPGKWEMETTMTSSVMGTRTQTDTECITEEMMDPRKLAEGMPEGACDYSTSVSGDTMDMEIKCNMEGMVLTGSGQAVRDGDDAMTSNMTMKGDMGGMSMEMKIDTKGRRIGDC